MISGYTKLDNDKSLFEYENKVLKIKYEGEELYNNIFRPVKCKKFPNYNDIYFYIINEQLIYKGTNEYYPDLVIDFKNNYSEIAAINIELDELDAFYDKNLTDQNFDNFNESGEITIKAKPFDETDSKKYNIIIKEKEMTMQIIVGKSFNSNSSIPVTLSKKIRIEYEFKNDYSLLYETIKVIKKFISFIAYRKNIMFKNITIQSRNNQNLLYQIGTIEYIDKSFIERKTNIEYISEHSYFYENICDNISTLLNKISTNEMDLLNIPKDDYMINIYNEERILMIASSFENLFTLLYKDKITHKESSIKMRKYFSEFLIDKEKEINLINGEYINFWNKLKRYVEFDNYSSKINEVLRKDKFIDSLMRRLYEKNGATYNRSLMTKRIEAIRNKCAHGEYRKYAENSDLICIKALELIVYYLQLKYIGVNINNINIILFRIFRISLPNDILDKIQNQ